MEFQVLLLLFCLLVGWRLGRGLVIFVSLRQDFTVEPALDRLELTV